MTLKTFLEKVRNTLGQLWMVLVFGTVYLVSQITIGALLEQAGPRDIGILQVTGFTADTYIDTFQRWEAKGTMPFYRAHFVVDGIHWLWYTLSLLALLSFALQRANAPPHYNAVLVLPLIAGPCDALENAIQHIFLSEPDYVAIVNPLPLISTLASITKWSLVIAALLALATLTIKALRNRG